MSETAESGVWAICDLDWGETITMVYPNEIEALRVVNGRGYGRVRFIPWGKDLNDLDRADSAASSPATPEGGNTNA